MCNEIEPNFGELSSVQLRHFQWDSGVNKEIHIRYKQYYTRVFPWIASGCGNKSQCLGTTVSFNTKSPRQVSGSATEILEGTV